ncbi:MAG: hypothetical protein AB8H80_15360 [Planctomycetota bacterium]
MPTPTNRWIRHCVAFCSLCLLLQVLPAQGEKEQAPAAGAAPAAEPTARAAATAVGQEPGTQTPDVPFELNDTTRMALRRLATGLAEKRAALAAAQKAGNVEALPELEEAVRKLRYQFTYLAAHLDMQEFVAPGARKFNLQSEIEDLIRPLLQTIKETTAVPRQVADLKASRLAVETRREVALSATKRIRETIDQLPADNPARATAQAELDSFWKPLLDDLGGEYLILTANLDQLQAKQKPFLTIVSEGIDTFRKERGLTLLLSVLVFVAVFFTLRLIARVLLMRRGKRSFPTRLLEVVLQAMTIVLAAVATLVVPYVRDDWFLLALGIIFLVGAGWVILKTAPQFFEQIRLMLNVGAVREGERILVDGLPYRVESLRFYSRLRNPELSGGRLRVPIRDLIHQRSRPVAPDEPWFPCREGDMVGLSDGTTGMVQMQTPECVVLTRRDDAPRSIPTAAFLALSPKNLSKGFEITSTFGVDYRHQADVLDAVPAAMQAKVKSYLADDPDAAAILSVRVMFQTAGASSLDLIAIVTCSGEAAPRFFALRRAVHTALVAACNEQGYAIPFPQLQVHGVGLPSGS